MFGASSFNHLIRLQRRWWGMYFTRSTALPDLAAIT